VILNVLDGCEGQARPNSLGSGWLGPVAQPDPITLDLTAKPDPTIFFI